MATVILLRHARSTANGSGVLAGRSLGVGLDERGQAQAAALVGRLKDIPVSAVVSSPLQRCEETLAPLLADRALEAVAEPDVSEVDYGAWTGKALKDLFNEPLWAVVQQHPSAVTFLRISTRALGRPSGRIVESVVAQASGTSWSIADSSQSTNSSCGVSGVREGSQSGGVPVSVGTARSRLRRSVTV